MALDVDAREPIVTYVAQNAATVDGTPSGFHEQNAQAILNTVLNLFETALREIEHRGANTRTIRGIVITGQMHGVVLVDSHNRPRSNLLTWRDRRATGSSVVESLRTDDAMESRCGCRLQPGYGFATLHQLLVDDRELSAELGAGTARICGITDLIAAMFCGELVTDASMAASWGGLDIRTHQWDEQVLDALRIPRKALPSVLPSSHPYGSIRPEFASKYGLDIGTSICSGIGDHQAGVLACRPISVGTCVVNVGTGSQVSMVQCESKSARGLETRPLLPGYFIASGTGLCGGWSYEYLARFFQSVIEAFADIEMPLNAIYRTMNEAGRTEAKDADGLTVEPLFLGSRTDSRATGSIRGIGESNLRPSSLVRATANGIVDELFDCFPRAEAHARQLFVTGNAARRIPMLREAVRDRWGTNPRVIEHDQEAALGAAYLAAVNLDLMDRSWLLSE